LPFDITTDGTNLYVADSGNNTIRKIVIATGTVSTLAGTAGNFGFDDGIGAAASFDFPIGITTDGLNLYVSDTSNNTIRKVVIATGTVSTLAGTADITGTGNAGSADGSGAAASFDTPGGIVTDGVNLYLSDSGNSTIRKIVIASGEVSTLAGSAGNAGSANGIGAAASFNVPSGITTDGTNLYLSDTANNTIRKIVLDSVAVSTLAGTAGDSGSADGISTSARFDNPNGITTDGTNLYVVDSNNSTIRKIQ
jgi:sugar lactone lactonase YvrE